MKGWRITLKFLKNVTPGMNIMPINFIYHNERNYDEDDALDIIYKIIDTSEVVVETIEKPKIEVWIVKEQYRQHIMTSRDYLKKEYLEPHLVRYRNRYSEIAKILNIPKDAVKACPWVLQSNIDIKTAYAIQFRLEYYNECPKKLNIGLFDIESDTINIDHFPKVGECPTNLISFVDAEAKCAWQFVLESDGPTRTINPDTGKYYDNTEQIQYLKAHQEEYIQECHKMFDESYGADMQYQLVFFKDEMKMTRALFDLMELSGINYSLAWNLPYDMGNLLGRPDALCRDPKEICCSKQFKYKDATFTPDDNPDAHKRKHDCQFSSTVCFVDFLVLYAGIRAGKGKMQSLKLSAVAKNELKDDKLDYSEFGNIRTAAYENFWLFAKYSMKDSLLLYGLHKKTNDIANLYQRCYSYGLMPNEIFTTTALLTNALTVYYFEKGLVVGNNRNKFKDTDIASFEKSIDFDDFLEDDEEFVEAEEEEETPTPGKKKKKQFEGAMVQNPNRMLSTGFKINGILISKIHEFLIDEDVTSLYPSEMRIMNLSNDTMIGRVTIPYDMEDYFKLHCADKYHYKNHMLCEDDDVKRRAASEYLYNRFPMTGYDFIDDEKDSYKINVSDVFCMMLAANQWSELGTNFFNLPSFDELDAELMKRLEHEKE